MRIVPYFKGDQVVRLSAKSACFEIIISKYVLNTAIAGVFIA
jgi:hypothetical protein